jgi:hypothetical protein
MIFIENKGPKIWLLIFLVFIFSGLVFWLWLGFNPQERISLAKKEGSLVGLLKEQSQEALTNIKDSLVLSQLQFNNLRVEWQRQAKEKMFIEKVKEHLSNAATSTKANNN